jgi:hypothetical protein
LISLRIFLLALAVSFFNQFLPVEFCDLTVLVTLSSFFVKAFFASFFASPNLSPASQLLPSGIDIVLHFAIIPLEALSPIPFPGGREGLEKFA